MPRSIRYTDVSVRRCATATLALLTAQLACAPRIAAPVGAPAADPAVLATEIARGTAHPQPRQLGFAWALNESGTRVNGSGVVRVVAPERARLDLFGPRNETYLAAALVGEQLRLPSAAPTAGVPLPSPALLWAALGVVRPPAAAELVAATRTDSTATLRYRTAGGELFQYQVATLSGAPRLAQLERSSGSNVLETVRIERGPAGELGRVRYRDWSAFRDLTLDVESVKDVASFPESIWTP